VTDAGEALWLEVNTLPGLSRQGNLARMADADGITYEQLLTHILRGARTNRREHA
jgi:D-alanine-D-alanine ligase